jgi:hypothetical protein
MTTVSSLIRHLEQHYDRDDTLVAHIWSTADVLEHSDFRGCPVDEATAVRIIEAIEHRLDCTIGITWEVIDHWLDHFRAIEPQHHNGEDAS